MTTAIAYLGTALAGGPLAEALHALAERNTLHILATYRDDAPPLAPLCRRLGLCRAIASLRPSHTLLAEAPDALAPIPSAIADALALELAHRKALCVFLKNDVHAAWSPNTNLARSVKDLRTAIRLARDTQRHCRQIDRTPYGYGRHPSRHVLVRDPEEQAVIALIIAQYTAGKRLTQIQTMLTNEGIAPRGRSWHWGTIRRILIRAGYDGVTSADRPGRGRPRKPVEE